MRQKFLVMELAGGEDLAERLVRQPLDREEVLSIALQIARALEEAHERGVVHRDLKPANVKVTAEGQVKLLDFGLATALTPQESSGQSVDLALSPTLTYQPTMAGVLLGTASYMSPEQARGKAVDRRTDIWAFGVVLHEMLTGRRVFAGETITDILASVIQSEPDLEVVPEGPLRRLLARCLEKDHSRRLRDIGEARILLEDLLEGRVVESSMNALESTEERRSRRVATVGLAALAILVGVGGFLLGREQAVEPVVSTASEGVAIARKLTFGAGLEHEPELSPDGNYLAYTGNDSGNLDVNVLPLAGGASNRITTDLADDAQAVWSPDGTRIAFVSARNHGGRLGVMPGLGRLTQYVFSQNADVFVMPARGGQAAMLVENASHPTWSPDGQRIAFASNRFGRWDIWSVPARGGEPLPLTDDAEIDFQPTWSPDGGWIAFGTTGGLGVISADGGIARRISPVVRREVEAGAGWALAPSWSPDGRWITYSVAPSGVLNLWRTPFEPEDGSLGTPAERVSISGQDQIEASLGSDGLMAYASIEFTPDIWELDAATGETVQLTRMTSFDDYPHLGADGRTVALESNRGGYSAIWFHDRVTGEARQISPDGLLARTPRWSPDGDSIAYYATAESDQSDQSVLYLQRLGEISGTPLPAPLSSLQEPTWSPDGLRIAAHESDGAGLWVLGLDGSSGSITDGAASGHEDLFPCWSPDGEWIVFNRAADFPRQIWITRPDGTETHKVEVDDTLELSHPQWSPRDPDKILVAVDHKNLAVVSISRGTLEYLTHFDDSTLVVDYPSWSLDGRLVHFSLAQNRGDIYLVSRESP